MFSKKILFPQPAGPAAQPVRASDLARAALSNPYVGAGGAAALLLAGIVALIGIGGDPRAGEPVVRISLAKVAGAAAPPGWRAALKPESTGAMSVSEAVFQLSEAPVAPMLSDPGAQAIITMTDAAGPSADGGLPPAPIAGLFTPGPSGPLPIIAADGRTPFQAYARPFTSNGRPKVGLIIGGLGLNAKATREAIETLPPQITLSFVPYADGLQAWIDLARAHGHEVMLEAPMEPADYPANDPGPYTLLTAGSSADTAKKLEWVLSRASGYFGLTNYLGSRFLASDPAVSGFATALRGRGLAFIDDGQAARRGGGGLPRASADRVIDDQLSETAIAQQLAALESGASQHGHGLGSGFAYPVTLAQAKAWTDQVESRGFQLAPASAFTVTR